MQRFRCPSCGAEVFVADLTCLACGHDIALEPVTARVAEVGTVEVCANRAAIDCNWVATSDGLCRSCTTTRVVPPTGNVAATAGWAAAETAKRRLVLQLLGLGLLEPEPSDTDPVFEMLWSGDGSVTIGHADGVITIDVGESDDVRRERLRHRLAEPYRTMLGHLRHEIGHFYWPSLADRPDTIDRVRDHFGDDTVDYADAIERHYGSGPPEGWSNDFISEYATMHPWEDWAESFAHYLHLRDVLDTATRFGLAVGHPTLDGDPVTIAAVGTGPIDFALLVQQWQTLTVAVNALNRSMDQPDLYPFAPSDVVLAKFEVVHDLVGRTTAVAAEEKVAPSTRRRFGRRRRSD